MFERSRPECGRSVWRTWVVALAGVGLIASAAQANHQRGIRVTVTGTDAEARTVEVDVTVYTGEEGAGTPTSEEATPIGAESPFRPAISWGEGETIAETSIEFESGAPPRARYRRSFSHTYEEAGPFTIVVSSACCGDELQEILNEGSYTGNPQFDPEATPESAESVTVFTNTALVVFQQSVLEIPTASTVGLGLLSLALAGAGFWLIRR